MELFGILSSNWAIDIAPPLILIVFGFIALAVVPRKPNRFAGYRTPMSCKNQDTWAFAHKHFGKQMIIGALILLLLSVESHFQTDNGVSVWITVARVIVALFIFLPTEIALKRTFDKNGERRK